jgi:hypothetical protein
MKFTRSTYPDIPGRKGSPCWQVKGRRLWADIDWNTRWPFGLCGSVLIGRYRVVDAGHGISMPRSGISLDVNAPLGEPNRLVLTLGRWRITLGLISWWTFRATGRKGRVIEGDYVRCRPHLEGLSRYRYHLDSSSRYVRNDKPESLHWGWLTIEKDERACARTT